MKAFLISTGVVALSEIGDKTQLLALLLAARFKRPAPIILGIFAATIFNHAAAGLVGGLAASALDPDVLRWGLGLLFIGVGIWALVPDTLGEDERAARADTALNIFWVTTIAFFLAEIGDKTQIATIALAARFQDVATVVLGTTLGMLLADVPAVYLGQAATAKIHSKWIRYAAAAIFAAMGVLTIAADEIGTLPGLN